MSKFQPTITERDQSLNVVKPAPADVGDPTPAMAIDAVSKAIDVGVKLYDRSIVNEFAEISGETVSDSLGGIARDKAIVAREILDAPDASTVNRISKIFENLETAERNNKLSMQGAAMRKDATLRAYSNKYPWLASQFRTIAKGQAGASAIAEIEPSVEEKAWERIRINAAEHGVSEGRMLENMRISAEKKAAAEKGAFSAPELTSRIMSQVSMHSSAFMAQMMKDITTNPDGIDATDYKAMVQVSKQAVFDDLYKQNVELARNGVLVDTPTIKDLEAQINQRFNSLEELAKAEDKAVIAKNFITMNEKMGLEIMDNIMPGFGQLAKAFGPQTASQLLGDTTPKILSKIKQGNTLPQLRALLETVPYGNFMLDYILSGKGITEAITRIGKGEEQNEAFNFLSKQMAKDIIANPDISANDPINESSHRELLTSDNPLELAAYEDTGVFAQTIKDSKTIKALSNRLTNELASIVQVLQQEQPIAKVDPLMAGAIDPATAWMVPTETEKSVVTFSNGTFESDTLATTNLTDTLGLLYRLNKKYGLFDTTEQDWVDEVLEKINAVPSKEQPTVQPVQEEAEEDIKTVEEISPMDRDFVFKYVNEVGGDDEDFNELLEDERLKTNPKLRLRVMRWFMEAAGDE